MTTSDASSNNFHDPWGIWASRIVRKRDKLLEVFWSFYCQLNCLYWKRSVGKGCHFRGKMIFRRNPGSIITIGNNCKFYSAAWSNMVGINRQCILGTMRPNAKITIGDETGLSGTIIIADESIKIGSNVLCGANVTIIDCDSHHVIRSQEGITDPPSAPVVIGSNVWLDMNVIVLKGVTIGHNTVIAANSVVTKNLPSNVLAAGQPAKIVKYL